MVRICRLKQCIVEYTRLATVTERAFPPYSDAACGYCSREQDLPELSRRLVWYMRTTMI